MRRNIRHTHTVTTICRYNTIQSEDVSIFSYQGQPILALQTCTGNWHELRTMSYFSLEKVVKFNPNAVRDKQHYDHLMQTVKGLTNMSANNPVSIPSN